jgi:hypothetical protein
VNNLPGFSSDEQARPPGKRELARQAKEAKALALWYQTLDEGAVRRELKLPSNEAARVLINRAVERWHDEVVDHARRLRTYKDHLLLKSAMKLSKKLDEGELQRVPDLVKVLQEISKLHDIDARSDNTGPQVVVIDSRPPWEREAPIEGEGEVMNPPGLPSGE